MCQVLWLHVISCHVIFSGNSILRHFFKKVTWKKWQRTLSTNFKEEKMQFEVFSNHRFCCSYNTFMTCELDDVNDENEGTSVWFSALNSLYICVLSSWNNNDGNEEKILTGFFLREPAKRDWSSARVFESVALWQSISLHIQSKFFKVFPQQSISLQIHLFTAKWNEFSTEKTPPREMVLANIYFEAGGAFRVDVLSVLD